MLQAKGATGTWCTGPPHDIMTSKGLSFIGWTYLQWRLNTGSFALHGAWVFLTSQQPIQTLHSLPPAWLAFLIAVVIYISWSGVHDDIVEWGSWRHWLADDSRCGPLARAWIQTPQLSLLNLSHPHLLHSCLTSGRQPIAHERPHWPPVLPHTVSDELQDLPSTAKGSLDPWVPWRLEQTMGIVQPVRGTTRIIRGPLAFW